MAMTTKMREFRASLNMTQDELAALVGVRRETIINLEKGRYNPSLKLAMDIAKVFSCTVEEVFFFSEEGKT
jgi:Predicted transcriptional regulators